jgi:hypothetical protein
MPGKSGIGRRLTGLLIGLLLGCGSAFIVALLQWRITARGEDSELGMLGVYAIGILGGIAGGSVGFVFAEDTTRKAKPGRVILAALLAAVVFFLLMQILWGAWMYPADTLGAIAFWLLVFAAIGALVSGLVLRPEPPDKSRGVNAAS